MSQLPSDPNAKPTLPELSPALKRLLDGGNLHDLTPTLQAEARSALPRVEEIARRPAGEAGVRAVVGRRFALYPQADRSDAEWAAWWEDYYDALADLPMVALEAAMAAYVRDPASEFLPKPGKLRDLAMRQPNQTMELHDRLRVLANYRRPEPSNAVYEIPAPQLRNVESDRAKIREMMADFRRPERAPQRRDFPATHGRVDAGGITPELRAIMERRNAERGDAA